jgi:hypothetical protein
MEYLISHMEEEIATQIVKIFIVELDIFVGR